MIELIDVTKVFNQGRANEFAAIRRIHATIDRQQITVLKGPSGSGKTTLLSLIGCLARPTSGRIFLEGRNLSGLPERFMTEVRRRTFGFVFQQFNLIKGLTVLDNITLPAYPLARPWKELHHNACELLEQFGIREKADNRVEWLSGGEAQRTAICRALINNPQVLIADEPTANLDTGLSEDLMQIISRLREGGKTVIVTSHDPIVFDSPIVDRRIEMRDGQVTGTS